MMASAGSQLSVAVTTTLSAELAGQVPGGLVADIVRAMLDEPRQSFQDRGVEPTMREARRRLERLVRAARPR